MYQNPITQYQGIKYPRLNHTAKVAPAALSTCFLAAWRIRRLWHDTMLEMRSVMASTEEVARRTMARMVASVARCIVSGLAGG